MIQTLWNSPTFAAFLAAGFLLAITPGPGVVYLVTRTLSQGRGAGLASVVGIALGNFANATAASAGLAAVLSASASAFTAVKLSGAAYLVFLGLRTMFGGSAAGSATSRARARAAPLSLFRAAFMVALLNPKTALFFAALLPQFMRPGLPVFAQSVAFGSVFVGIAMCTDTLYVLSAAMAAAALSRRTGARNYGRYLTAATFIGLGVYAGFASPKSMQ